MVTRVSFPKNATPITQVMDMKRHATLPVTTSKMNSRNSSVLKDQPSIQPPQKISKLRSTTTDQWKSLSKSTKISWITNQVFTNISKESFSEDMLSRLSDGEPKKESTTGIVLTLGHPDGAMQEASRLNKEIAVLTIRSMPVPQSFNKRDRKSVV